ncbi:glutamate carboxypeptidase LAMP1 [Hirschfeldia incana]|nr:glutamate carboxypeptidase LAMP1 [Hirschfeldia incana]
MSITTTTTSLAFLLAALSYLLLFSSPPKPHFHTLFLSPSFSDNASIALNLRTLTRRPHVAGSEANAEAAAFVLSSFTSSSLKTRLVSYQVSLTYPLHRSLVLTPKHSAEPITFALKQEHVGDNIYANEVTPTFHGYAKSGNVSGPVAYANYGRVQDFAGLNVSGAVVVARYGEIYRGDIVRNAYGAGAVGVVIYTDKRDYGGGGDECFPASKWMPPSGVQVGTVYNGLGDPTTPGWASVDGCERLSEEDVERSGDSPGIPSLPISAGDAEVILKSIVGDVADGDVNPVGPGPGILNLSYIGKTVIAKIENVIGVIEGKEEPDRYVILGNHRDAWSFGAVDPNSGTAVLLEIAQRLDKLLRRGWKPRRTIILCNWDAEEYALIGSTEWVEENREMLASRAVAYLNVDCGVSGPGFRASATPQLDELIKQAAREVQDPDNTTQTVYDSWVGSSNSGVIGRLGDLTSDYASFVQHVGVPSTDMRFGGGYPVYHSMYDDFTWMKKFGDPTFQRHVAVASVLGLVALRLADEEVLPFNYVTYASELMKSAEDLEKDNLGHGIDVSPLLKSIQDLSTAAQMINIEKEGVKGALKVRELNDRLMMAERALTDRDGLSGRTWYKHLVYGPAKYDEYGSKSFPGIDDAIDNAKRLETEVSWRLVQHEIWRVSRAVRHASLVLKECLAAECLAVECLAVECLSADVNVLCVLQNKLKGTLH